MVELDFGSMQLEIGGSPTVSCLSEKYNYPDPGSRDAICALIGVRVDRLRVVSGERVEISYENGWDITVLRSGLAVA